MNDLLRKCIEDDKYRDVLIDQLRAEGVDDDNIRESIVFLAKTPEMYKKIAGYKAVWVETWNHDDSSEDHFDIVGKNNTICGNVYEWAGEPNHIKSPTLALLSLMEGSEYKLDALGIPDIKEKINLISLDTDTEGAWMTKIDLPHMVSCMH